MSDPTLIAVAHGTRSPDGRRQIQELAAAVARRRPGLDVRLCYVDVQEPKVADIVPAVREAVVVPLLLACGYHVRVDIAEAVAGTGIPVTGPLGPDPILLDSMLRNLPEADAVVLVAAGSSDPLWRAEVDEVAARLPGGAAVGYTSGPGSRVAEGVARLRDELATLAGAPVDEIADQLLTRLLPGGAEDDVALIAVRLDRQV